MVDTSGLGCSFWLGNLHNGSPFNLQIDSVSRWATDTGSAFWQCLEHGVGFDQRAQQFSRKFLPKEVRVVYDPVP